MFAAHGFSMSLPAAVALRAALRRTDALTGLERDLLREWLDRIANTAG